MNDEDAKKRLQDSAESGHCLFAFCGPIVQRDMTGFVVGDDLGHRVGLPRRRQDSTGQSTVGMFAMDNMSMVG